MSLTPKERRMIVKLRSYYRVEFQNGCSDESFLLWLECALKIINGDPEL